MNSSNRMTRAALSMDTDVRERMDRVSARTLIVLAVILELQMPRFAGDLRFALVLFSLGASIVVLSRLYRKIDPFRLLSTWPVAVFGAYVGWCFLSSLWSAVPTETILQSGLMLLALLLSLSYSTIPRYLFARELVRAAVAVSVISWLLVPVLPEVAALPDVTWRLNGPFQHPQRLSLFVGLGLVVLVAMRVAGRQVFRTRWGAALAAVILLTTLMATQARANTIFVIVVIGAVVFYKAAIWQKMLMIVTLVAGVVVLSRSSDALLQVLDREGSNTLTLTGRTRTWEAASELIGQNPVAGYGFGSFFSPLTQQFFSSGYVTPHAHNTWVNAAFETGYIGATLLSLFLIGSIFAGGARGLSNNLTWPVVVLAVMAGMMGIVFGGKVTTLSVIVVAMIAQSTREWQDRNPHNMSRFQRLQ